MFLIKEFAANRGLERIVRNRLANPVLLRYIRLHMVKTNNFALRAEFFGNVGKCFRPH